MAKRWLPPAQPTAFQSLMLEYMWLQRPPLDMTRLAHAIDVPENTVRGWFSLGHIPHPTRLRQVALHTGIPLPELYRAAGYDVPAPAAYAPPVPAVVWDSFERWAEEVCPGADAIPRGDLIEQIRSLRRGETEQYAARIAAEHRIVEAEPTAPQAASGEEISATDRQQEEPAQATRTRRRPRREMARTS